MNITEKLVRLTEGKRQADVARSAELKPTQLRDYTAKGSLPRYDIALRLARALKVPVEWLVDDKADWPPPPKDAEKASLINRSDRELMLEIARRYCHGVVAVLDALDQVKKENWERVWKSIEQWREGDPMPAEAKRLRLTFRSSAVSYNSYDIAFGVDAMTFKRKLKVLLRDRKQGAIARSAGIHPLTLGNCLNHDATPGIDTAIKLANALGVDVGWLIDDRLEWPPVPSKFPAPIPQDESLIAA